MHRNLFFDLKHFKAPELRWSSSFVISWIGLTRYVTQKSSGQISTFSFFEIEKEYEDKLIKLVVRKKSDTKKFEKFVDKLYSANVADMKIVENFDFSGWYESVGDEVETEDTLSILNRYIKESEVDLDKNRIEILIGEVYQEACELV